MSARWQRPDGRRLAVVARRSTNVISKYEACEDEAVKTEAAEPTHLASERMPAPGQPHQVPARQVHFQASEPLERDRSTGPYLSGHAGTRRGGNMNYHSRPSACEDCVTSRDRTAPPGSIHHPHQGPEQQVPRELTVPQSAAHQSAADVTRLVIEAVRLQTEAFAQVMREQNEAAAERARVEAAERREASEAGT